jgi:hypothetical protein
MPFGVARVRPCSWVHLSLGVSVLVREGVLVFDGRLCIFPSRDAVEGVCVEQRRTAENVEPK